MPPRRDPEGVPTLPWVTRAAPTLSPQVSVTRILSLCLPQGGGAQDTSARTQTVPLDLGVYLVIH